MTTASHAVGPEFDSRSSYAYNAPLVQWLEFTVANGEARVRFSDGAIHKITGEECLNAVFITAHIDSCGRVV